MRVLVCGSRRWRNIARIEERVGDLPADAVVITGRASGADTIARNAARDRGLWLIDVPCEDAHWRKHGRSAGHKRNGLMLGLAPTLVIAFQRNGSPGTQGTIEAARRLGTPVEVHTDDD